MNYREFILKGGWFWYHLQGVRESTALWPKEWMALTPGLRPIRNSSDWPAFNRYLWLFYWNYLQDYPDPDPILSGTTKNIIDRDKRCL